MPPVWRIIFTEHYLIVDTYKLSRLRVTNFVIIIWNFYEIPDETAIGERRKF